MGRTVMPYSMQIDRVQQRFQKFRRSLRRDDQEIFDQLFRDARRQVQAGVMAANPNPADSVFLSALIATRADLRKQQRIPGLLRLQYRQIPE